MSLDRHYVASTRHKRTGIPAKQRIAALTAAAHAAVVLALLGSPLIRNNPLILTPNPEPPAQTLAHGAVLPSAPVGSPFDAQHLPEGVFIAVTHLKLIPRIPVWPGT